MSGIGAAPGVAIVLKGYPRLSETFIARELLALQECGLRFVIVALRRPTDRLRHDLHERIAAPCFYLPEYLHEAPRRVLRGLRAAVRLAGFGAALGAWLRDLRRDPTRNRWRRFGQAAVLAAELPGGIAHLHAHFIHTPGSVARYAALMRRLPLSLSAHAKDIWTIPDWEKREKLEAARWTVTCTEVGRRHLAALAPGADVELLYHGVDTRRFAPPRRPQPTGAAGSAAPLRTLSVARCVTKKGLGPLLDALAALPARHAWQHTHVGDGPLLAGLRAQAERLGIAGRVRFLGALPQLEVVAELERADLFVLASRTAEDGDRDGLPNVLLEAMSMALPVVGTEVAAIPEAIRSGIDGLLVPADDPAALARALALLLGDAGLRARLGAEARATVLRRFGEEQAVARLAHRFGLDPAPARAA